MKNVMKNVLVVLTVPDAPEEAIDYAVGAAKKAGARVVALYILEGAAARDAFDKFTDIGFVGDKPSAELSESLMRVYRQRGYEELGKVQIKTMEAGLEIEPLVEEGELLSKVLEHIEKWDAVSVVIVKKKERRAGYFSRDPVEEIKKRTSCEVTVFEA